MKVTTSVTTDDDEEFIAGVVYNKEMGDYRVEIDYATDVMFIGPDAPALAKLFVEMLCSTNSQNVD